MTAKSTLNSKLGRVSEIRFCSAAGKDMATKLYTAENAAFTVKLGFKQPANRVDNYQIQYRTRSRFTPANAKAKGADWTKWGDWQNLIAFGSGASAVPLGSKKSADEWLRSNKGVNKKSAYVTFYEFSGVKVNGKYDARQYQIRIRTYNAKTRKHGAWVTQTLSVYKAAVVANETIHVGSGGRLTFDCNYIWGREGTVHVDSIIDSTGRELLNAKVSCAMNYDSQRQGAINPTPAYRNGYTPGEFEVKVGSDGLKRAIRYGERLTWKAYYKTKDGAKTYFKSPIRVSTQDITINMPRVTASTDDSHGWLKVRAYKNDADDMIERVSCVVDYTYKGKAYTVKPSAEKLNLSVQNTTSSIAVWTFKDLPTNIELSVKVRVRNGYHSSKTVKATTAVHSKWWLLSKVGGGKNDYAALQWNRALTVTSRPKCTIGLPHGRGKPFVSYMKGSETTLQLSGEVHEVGGPKWHKYATLAYIDKLRNNQGVYLLRGPYNGEMYKVAVTEVSRHCAYPDERKHEVTIQMTEVS